VRTTITFDDELLKQAIKITGINEKSKLVNMALKKLVDDDVLERFLALEGTMPELEFFQREERNGREPLKAERNAK